MVHDILTDVICSAEGSQTLCQGLAALHSAKCGPVPKIIATSCAIGVIYFGARTLRNDLQRPANGDHTGDVPATRNPPPADLLGLAVSIAGFAAAVHLARAMAQQRSRPTALIHSK